MAFRLAQLLRFGLRVWPGERLTPQQAQERLRAAIFAAIEPSLTAPVHRALDMGCSVGVGTRRSGAGWIGARGAR